MAMAVGLIIRPPIMIIPGRPFESEHPVPVQYPILRNECPIPQTNVLTNDSGCWAIYEGAGVSCDVGNLKAYGCFTGYDWTTMGVGEHTFQVTHTLTNLSVTAGNFYSIILYSLGTNHTNYVDANCSDGIYNYRGRSFQEGRGTLDGMESIDNFDTFPPPSPAKRK